MQAGRNPNRRNRNIGTSKQGHGQDNKLVIPDPLDGYYWLDRIDRYTIEKRQIAGRNICFIVEENKLGCVHPCTVSDVVHVLEALPQADWAGLDTFLFRQPTRKQLALSPAWGRLQYFAEIVAGNGKLLAKGPAIYLEAINVEKPLIWSTSLDPDHAQELERLKSDGHEVTRQGRKHNIKVTVSSARNTQLFRTLLHEVGHWFDWLSKVEGPAANGGNADRLEEAYFSRPKAEREAFAHRYADELRASLEAKGAIPLPPSLL